MSEQQTKQQLIDKREKERLESMGWSVAGVWNEMLNLTKRYPPKVRNYISASDLGKDYWGRYMKMMGTPETDPYEDRVLRIFSAGDEFHNLMKNVFRACGIFINSQDDKGWSIVPETKTKLKVLGKYDALVGGIPDYIKTKKHCEEWGFSEFVKERTLLMVERLLDLHPKGMNEMIYEIKSINSMAFWNKKDYLQEAYPWHQLQLYAYLKANNIKEGRLLYISKDDLTTMEFSIIYPTERLEAMYDNDVEKMSSYVLKNEEPPKPDYVIYNEYGKIRFQKDKKKHVITGAYEANWEVLRSPFFQLITGFKNKEDWESSIKEEIYDKNNKRKAKFIEKNLK